MVRKQDLIRVAKDTEIELKQGKLFLVDGQIQICEEEVSVFFVMSPNNSFLSKNNIKVREDLIRKHVTGVVGELEFDAKSRGRSVHIGFHRKVISQKKTQTQKLK